jgi:hypothetical protein
MLFLSHLLLIYDCLSYIYKQSTIMEENIFVRNAVGVFSGEWVTSGDARNGRASQDGANELRVIVLHDAGDVKRLPRQSRFREAPKSRN